MVDMSDLKEFADAIQPNTRLIICETPSNPLMKLIDLKAIADITRMRSKDILIMVDNTFMSAYFQVSPSFIPASEVWAQEDYQCLSFVKNVLIQTSRSICLYSKC